MSAAATLSHYSADPIDAVHDSDPSIERGAYKPSGLWLSVDGEDDWPDWCGRNNFRCGKNVWHYRVTLAAGADVLRITEAHQLLRLVDTYGCSPYPGSHYLSLDWAKIAERYDGIVIAPYQWSLRLDARTHWYYGWDCASGVIWKSRAIASIELLGETAFADRCHASVNEAA